MQVDRKSNKTTAIPRLLEDLDCEGSIISTDAIGCQKPLLKKLLPKKRITSLL